MVEGARAVTLRKRCSRHPEVPAQSAGLEGRRGPGASAGILRGSLRSHLRMTDNRQSFLLLAAHVFARAMPSQSHEQISEPDLRQMTPAVVPAAITITLCT